MQNPQVQQLMSGMMSNAIGGPAAGVGGLSDLSSLIHAGQQFAQQIQQQNPELIEQLRNHVRSRSFSGSTEEHSWLKEGMWIGMVYNLKMHTIVSWQKAPLLTLLLE